MNNIPTITEESSRNDKYLHYLCQRKLAPIVALNSVSVNATSAELDLIGANSIKFYVEITGTVTIAVDVLGTCESGGVFISNGITKYFSTSQSFMLPCTSDFIKIQFTKLSGSPIVTIRVQGMSDIGVDDVVPKYRDLGQIINGVNMAAGAIIASSFIDNVQLVRGWRALYQSDQTCIIGIWNRDTGLIVNWGEYSSASLPITGSASWGGQGALSASSLLGYSAKFTLKNNSASANTFANLRLQLMGV